MSRALALAADRPRLAEWRSGALPAALRRPGGIADAEDAAAALGAAFEDIAAAAGESEARPYADAVPAAALLDPVPAGLRALWRSVVAEERGRLDPQDRVSPFLLADDALLAVLALLWSARPVCLLEFGSGLSTRVLARVRETLGLRRIVTVDDDPVWQQRVLRSCPPGPVQVVQVSVPLAWRDGADDPAGRGMFYDQTALAHAVAAAAEGGVAFDALLVDGPAAARGGNRTHALPSVRPMLRSGAVVVVDDAWRRDGLAAAGRWLADGLLAGWTVVTTERGLGFGRCVA